jgi:hypothetical protein
MVGCGWNASARWTGSERKKDLMYDHPPDYSYREKEVPEYDPSLKDDEQGYVIPDGWTEADIAEFIKARNEAIEAYWDLLRRGGY